MILIITIFIILNLILAKIDAKKILAQKPINHSMNAWVYMVTIVGTGALSELVFHFNWIEQISLLLSLLLTRKVVFDISLSLFRGLKWDYISQTTTSKIDQFENKIFKSGTVKYFFYGTLLLANIILNILL